MSDETYQSSEHQVSEEHRKPEEFLTIGFKLNYKKFPIFTLNPIKEINAFICCDFTMATAEFYEKVNQDTEYFRKIFELLETIRKIVGPTVMVLPETPVRVGVDKLITIIQSSKEKITLYAEQTY